MIALILNAVPAEVWAALGAIIAAALAWLVGRRGGVRAARDGARRQAEQDYRETTKDMRDADVGTGDPDDDTRWLREYSERQRAGGRPSWATKKPRGGAGD